MKPPQAAEQKQAYGKTKESCFNYQCGRLSPMGECWEIDRVRFRFGVLRSRATGHAFKGMNRMGNLGMAEIALFGQNRSRCWIRRRVDEAQ